VTDLIEIVDNHQLTQPAKIISLKGTPQSGRISASTIHAGSALPNPTSSSILCFGSSLAHGNAHSSCFSVDN